MRLDLSFPRPPSLLSIKYAVFLGLTMLVAAGSHGCAEESASPKGRNYFQGTLPRGEATAPATPLLKAAPAPIPRKIIYDARIDLLVKSLDATERAVLELIKDNKGFLAESNIAAQSGNQREATWRVRVSVDRFDSFVSAVGKLGEVRTNHVGSQDVTEEFADLEARIRNKQEEEKRLLKHLADSTGKLEDILAVERELSRVRGEIEQMQGRLRFLANRADLSTVTITATEWKDYIPPAPITFQAQLSHSFFRSLDALVVFGKTILLVLVALVPWTPLIVIGFLVLIWILRAERRATARRSSSAPVFTADDTSGAAAARSRPK